MSPGEQLQSERELSQRFQVSPMTVRRALHKLSTEGYTSAIPGKGTFVRKCFYAKRADTSSFTDSMLAAGKVASAHLISATLRQATRGEEEALGLDKDTFMRRPNWFSLRNIYKEIQHYSHENSFSHQSSASK